MDEYSTIPRDWEIDQTSAIGPQIYRILRERIVYNDLKPGSSISEPAMAKEFGVSRQPVREAFIKLSDVGLVEIRPQRGTIVKKISYEEVMEARFVREAIEADIAKLLARNPDPSLIRELRRLLRAQTDVISSPVDFNRLDDQFHRTLADAAGKRQTWRFIVELKTQMDRVRILRLHQAPVERLINQHTAVVDAIEMGDGNQAVISMRIHLRELLGLLPQIFEAYPDLFEGPAFAGLNLGSSHMEETDEDAV